MPTPVVGARRTTPPVGASGAPLGVRDVVPELPGASGTVVMLPVVLAYTGFCYYLFRGKVSHESAY